MLSTLSAAFLCAVAQSSPTEPLDRFENLSIPALPAMAPSTNGTTKIWNGKLEILESGQALTFKQVGEVQLTVTDFTDTKPTPIPERVLVNYEVAVLGNKTLAGSHLRKTICKFGEKNVVVFDGSTIFKTPQRVSPMFLISFAFVDGTQLYQFQAITRDQDKYERMLGKLDGMTLTGKKITEWPSAAAGTFSIAGSPFSIKSPKALFPVLGEKVDESLEGQYTGAVYVPKGANYRYVLATLKESDSRTDEEILALLTRAALNVEVPKGLKLDPKTRKGQFTFDKGTVKYEAQLQFRRKGRLAAIVAASRVPTGYPFGGVELVEAKQP
ncbi:MAG: hypothetical protein JST40_09030 [Armatimonadetes bacterium]|nr:hypothetical protein [Armatimonadota bacterium]